MKYLIIILMLVGCSQQKKVQHFYLGRESSEIMGVFDPDIVPWAGAAMSKIEFGWPNANDTSKPANNPYISDSIKRVIGLWPRSDSTRIYFGENAYERAMTNKKPDTVISDGGIIWYDSIPLVSQMRRYKDSLSNVINEALKDVAAVKRLIDRTDSILNEKRKPYRAKTYFEGLPIVWDTTYYFWNNANANTSTKYIDTAFEIRIILTSENEPDTNWRNDYAFVYGMRYNGPDYTRDTLCSYWIASIMMRNDKRYLLQLKRNAVKAIRVLESWDGKETWADLREFPLKFNASLPSLKSQNQQPKQPKGN